MCSPVAHLGATHTRAHAHTHTHTYTRAQTLTLKNTCIEHYVSLHVQNKLSPQCPRAHLESVFSPNEPCCFWSWILDYFLMHCIFPPFCLSTGQKNVNNNDLSASEVESAPPMVSGWSDKCVKMQSQLHRLIKSFTGWSKSSCVFFFPLFSPQGPAGLKGGEGPQGPPGPVVSFLLSEIQDISGKKMVPFLSVLDFFIIFNIWLVLLIAV